MKTTVLALSAAFALGAAAAEAAPVDDAASVRVSYADLDLGHAAGRTALKRRVEHAVRRLCQAPSPIEPKGNQRYHECRESAWASVRPQLAAIYDEDRFASLIVRPTSD